jgi:hypothetical protein
LGSSGCRCRWGYISRVAEILCEHRKEKGQQCGWRVGRKRHRYWIARRWTAWPCLGRRKEIRRRRMRAGNRQGGRRKGSDTDRQRVVERQELKKGNKKKTN